MFVDLHKEELNRVDPRNVERRHQKEFHQWFQKYVTQLHSEASELVNDQLLNLACGPDRRVYRYKSFLINGWRSDLAATIVQGNPSDIDIIRAAEEEEEEEEEEEANRNDCNVTEDDEMVNEDYYDDD
ncbi:hypothetical protein J5N97_003403 [Dioscorea zingiberensis]|uniref:Uncharacterized protein n=1 Tax=Dioscorea zingiberensis TaxID=325984 RepID=A0A9D5D630_9LILI|nr:hypothetical protein J5N97_003403 [Dioscorea zingiberensis]